MLTGVSTILRIILLIMLLLSLEMFQFRFYKVLEFKMRQYGLTEFGRINIKVRVLLINKFQDNLPVHLRKSVYHAGFEREQREEQVQTRSDTLLRPLGILIIRSWGKQPIRMQFNCHVA